MDIYKGWVEKQKARIRECSGKEELKNVLVEMRESGVAFKMITRGSEFPIDELVFRC